MSTLILLLPSRQRLRAQGRDTRDAASRASAAPDFSEFDYLLTSNGRQIDAEGRASVAQLPRAEQVVLMPAAADLAWHRISLPRVNRNRWGLALAGLLEERLLDDPERLHFALEPNAQAGAEAWVATCPRLLLTEPLAVLEAAQIFVDRIAPLAEPSAQPDAYFELDADGALALHWSDAQGSAPLALQGGLVRARLAPLLGAATLRASPAAAAAAEAWLGSSISVQNRSERALAALGRSWDLRQFDLAANTRGVRAILQAGRALMRPQWRVVRWGLIGLLAVNVIGLNAMAWQQRRELDATQAAQLALLKATHPQVRAVRDAPLQMLRENETLRARAGRPGERDLETLLSAAATAWPAERPPLDSFTFADGRLSLPAQNWSEAQIDALRRQLQAEGWQLEVAKGHLNIQRASANKPGSSAATDRQP